MIEMIAGYLVYEVNDDLTIQDVLYQKRILYTRWEDAIAAASALAAEVAERWSTKPISILRSTSHARCESNGHVISHHIAPGSDIYVFIVNSS